MSTRSVIAAQDANNKGIYVHNDGYPSYMGVQLIKLINRDGIDKVVNTIIYEHGAGWSSINSEQSTEDRSAILRPEQCEVCTGYGIYYDDDRDGICSVTDQDYGYMIRYDGNIEVYSYGDLIGIISLKSDSAIYDMQDLDNV